MYVKHNYQMIPKFLSMFICKHFHFCWNYFTFIFIWFLTIFFATLFLYTWVKFLSSWRFFIIPCIIIKSFLWSSFTFSHIFFGIKSKKVSRYVVILIDIFDEYFLSFIFIISLILKCTKRFIVELNIRFFILSFTNSTFPKLIGTL
jgi:hypothetical protein